MKKILLTTSALTLLAGAAVADVSVGGYARIGVSNAGGATTTYLRNRLTFTGSATSDGGLTLSSWQRLRTSASKSTFSGDLQGFSAPNLSISNGAMALKLGNVSGAVSANGGVWGCGSVMWGCADLAGGSWASGSSVDHGPNIVRVDMSLGGAAVSISGGNDNSTEVAATMPMGGGSVSVGYNAGKATAAVAAVTAVAATVDSVTSNVYTPGVAAVASAASVASVAAKSTVFLGYSGSMGDMSVGVRIVQNNSKTGYMGNMSTAMGAGSVYIFAGKTLAASNNYGLTYSQSLGGGVSMQAGVASVAGATTVGAGVAFGF